MINEEIFNEVEKFLYIENSRKELLSTAEKLSDTIKKINNLDFELTDKEKVNSLSGDILKEKTLLSFELQKEYFELYNRFKRLNNIIKLIN